MYYLAIVMHKLVRSRTCYSKNYLRCSALVCHLYVSIVALYFIGGGETCDSNVPSIALIFILILHQTVMN